MAEVVTDDRGTNDVLDFQYTAFNLLALVYFFVQFFSNLTDGLPDIPATLLALSGVSVTAYGTKKALETGVGPQVTATSPRRLLLTKDSELVATGTGFVSLGGKPTDLNAVFLDGRKLPTPADKWSPTRVSITLPTTKEALKELGLRPKPDSTDPGKLVVQDDAGQSSDPYEITIEGPADWDDS